MKATSPFKAKLTRKILLCLACCHSLSPISPNNKTPNFISASNYIWGSPQASTLSAIKQDLKRMKRLNLVVHWCTWYVVNARAPNLINVPKPLFSKSDENHWPLKSPCLAKPLTASVQGNRSRGGTLQREDDPGAEPEGWSSQERATHLLQPRLHREGNSKGQSASHWSGVCKRAP